MSNPVSRRVDTFKLGSRTNAINATHKPMPIASISSQWPVSTQIQTIVKLSVKLKSSAAVKRPQKPNDMRLLSVHGLIMYWHIGSKRKARATVAITKIENLNYIPSNKKKVSWDLLAVHTAKSICIESKKKNITSRDTEAPKGKHSACIVSSVANLSAKIQPFKSNVKMHGRVSPSTITLFLFDGLSSQ